jgi:Family of unknown function (DUF5681)
MDDTFKPGPGRKPPPVEHQFLKGTSGNKKGRPKGSVDIKKLTRKVALKKHAVKVDGKIVRKTLLQLVIESTAREAAAGVPSMVALIDQIRAKVSPTEERQDVNHKVEEMCKAAQGLDTPLGKAVLAFHRRWG